MFLGGFFVMEKLKVIHSILENRKKYQYGKDSKMISVKYLQKALNKYKHYKYILKYYITK